MPDSQAVLYVEDDELIRELSAAALEEAGFKVVAADSGSAAFEALADDADPFCAMVTDVDLGAGPDGWEVARRGRELNDTLPVIYVSGGSGNEWPSRGVRNSIMIVKPYKITQIANAITALLKKICPIHRTL
jgi:DNA-binding response OmpR family regulator